jgi:hypothetical protein
MKGAGVCGKPVAREHLRVDQVANGWAQELLECRFTPEVDARTRAIANLLYLLLDLSPRSRHSGVSRNRFEHFLRKRVGHTTNATHTYEK